MNWYKTILFISTTGKGFHNFTASINDQLQKWHVKEGMAFLLHPTHQCVSCHQRRLCPFRPAGYGELSGKHRAGRTSLVCPHP